MRWLVVRGGALGDFILTTPAIRAVRERASHLTLAATPRFAALWPELADERTDIHGASALWLFGGGRAPALLPDAALVYTPGVADTLRRLGVPIVRESPPRPPPGVHAARALWAPVADFAPDRDPLEVLPGSLTATSDALRSIDPQLPAPWPVVLAPGAASPSKVWAGLRATATALQARGLPTIWVPGADEGALGDVPGPALPVLDLDALVAVAARCGAWIGNDTGTTHLAAAAGAPVIALFGPTDPAQWCPPGATAAPFDTPPGAVATLAETLRARRARS